ncbi:3-deoxy-D-manno-octulosonic-acid transferase [Candidatus Blochmanniella vafra str. BVAF]|uniref:3-deoxy-D-manno-octulosonic acid transferase n=1 Tax=Blochmanniella vafra (strain BVAF) TaxID=859654 RepID=E8Q788_BLOVB|nr:lipid IV(A) 3-deoxy-D-manno-octulosonic acid transferase [Candidatus Blochmannia vafer]ADV33983.1 3-deoxy-D-manno-octulosonic-acid transferase [Candidatus Blochmannia vafer str. BVAF]
MYIFYFVIYDIIMYIVQPIIWIRLLWLSIKVPEYRKNWLERYSYHYTTIGSSKLGGIVLHAVSVGEILSIVPLIKKFKKKYPNLAIIVTTMTPSGLKLACQVTINYQNVQCMYLPYDLPNAVKRFINRIKPKLFIIVETELWPNLIRTLYLYKIPIVILNARLSHSAFKKYKKISCFFKYIVQCITIVLAQDKENAGRFLKLGLKRYQLRIIGNLKFDVVVTHDILKQISDLKQNWTRNRIVWIAGSTHQGEEKILLKVHENLLTIFPNLLMILSPRHPERFSHVINITKNFGFSYITKSSGVIPSENIQVIINNTIGELMLLYGISDIAFVGGSLVPHGGHNPLEPATYAIPIIMGPYVFNFNSICSTLHKLGGLINIVDVDSLIKVMYLLLKDQELRLHYGKCAYKAFQKNEGVTSQAFNILNDYLTKNYVQ